MLRNTFRLYKRSIPAVVSSNHARRNLSFDLYPTAKKLSEITDFSKLSEESPENIKTIWNIYHEDQVHANGMTLTSAQHKKIIARAKICNMFIFPVLKEDGHMWILSQYQESAFVCTYLGEYQQDPATAKPWLTCVLYDDLLRSKELSLVRTDFLPSLTKSESVTLTRMIMAMYCNDDEYNEFVSVFNQKPNEFNVDDYLEKFKTRKGFIELKEEGEEE